MHFRKPLWLLEDGNNVMGEGKSTTEEPTWVPGVSLRLYSELFFLELFNATITYLFSQVNHEII